MTITLWQRLTGPLSSLARLGNQLLPTRCLLCGCTLRGDLLCAGCDLSLPHLDAGDRLCRQCALPFDSDATLCGQCLHQPPAFEHAVIPYRYQYPLDYLIQRFKYHRQLANGRVLAARLADHVRQHYADNPELSWPALIVPVPLHWSRRLRRGFNQAELIGQTLARHLGLPMHTRLCRRRERTPPQRGLSRAKRQRNLRNAFDITPLGRRTIRGKCVALLDDVVTTTSTARALSQLLLKAGAAEVHLWALARTPEARTGQADPERLQ
jgi:ComF family protein